MTKIPKIENAIFDRNAKNSRNANNAEKSQ